MATRNQAKPKPDTTPASRKPAAKKAARSKQPTVVSAPAPEPAREAAPPEAAPVRNLLQDNALAATPHAEEVILVFCAEVDVQNVTVCGTFNDWNQTANPLHRISPKTYAAKLRLAPGEYPYKFVVDGVWVEDPTAQQRIPDGHGSHNSVLLV